MYISCVRQFLQESVRSINKTSESENQNTTHNMADYPVWRNHVFVLEKRIQIHFAYSCSCKL